MPLSDEYEKALEILARAANAMTEAYTQYLTAKSELQSGVGRAAIDGLLVAYSEARDAHDEALADVWELIEHEC